MSALSQFLERTDQISDYDRKMYICLNDYFLSIFTSKILEYIPEEEENKLITIGRCKEYIVK